LSEVECGMRYSLHDLRSLQLSSFRLFILQICKLNLYLVYISDTKNLALLDNNDTRQHIYYVKFYPLQCFVSIYLAAVMGRR